ncbi:MAG: glyoxalase/bleomycin resistance/extradiol dioxygenase family protein [Rhodobacteraceae bacterium]|nr:glyoxalase/bleomycin resistance/extradiol dioxygenase family protein [Paracoccaceae bacterium]
MTPEAILETALYARDLDAAAAFYTDVFGLEEVLRVEGRHVFFGCGPGMLLIFNPEATKQASGGLPVPTHGAEGQGHMCFRASGADMDRWAAHLAKLDIAIEADFQWPNGARSIYVRDPAGNSVEISEPKLWNRPT